MFAATHPRMYVTWRWGEAALALVLLFGALAALAADEGTKKGTGTGFVRVRTMFPEPVVHQDFSRVSAKGFPERGCEGGCTLLPLQLRWNLETTFVSFSDGEQLYWLSGLTVALGYPAVDIYIPPRYRPGTCEYEAVLEHEKKHIEADRILLEEYADKIGTLLAGVDWPTYARPAAPHSLAEAHEHDMDRVTALVRPLMTELDAIRRRAGESVDRLNQTKDIIRGCSSPWRDRPG